MTGRWLRVVRLTIQRLLQQKKSVADAEKKTWPDKQESGWPIKKKVKIDQDYD